MHKLTKIITTIGPSSDSDEMIEKMLHMGVNVIRFNFKHNVVQWHDEKIGKVKEIALRLKKTVGILLDLQGPEIRIRMPEEDMTLEKGEIITLGEKALKEEVKGFSISHPQMLSYLVIGQQLIADDGAFSFEVVEIQPDIKLKSLNKGLLSNRKSLRVPRAVFPLPILIKRDYEGLDLVKRHQIDFVALSYVRKPEDIIYLKNEILKRKLQTKIVAKIETQSARSHLDSIIKESDILMIARGDLGIEMPIEQVPYWQKVIIGKCLEHAKPVITATQMLQSMTNNPYPTRAEVSDVANATYDLTDAVMLSGESAFGTYPLQTIEMMNKTVISNETKFVSDTRLRYLFTTEGNEGLICESAYNLYLALHKRKEEVDGFIVFTRSGKTVHLLSRYRPAIPIFAFAGDERVSNGLSLTFGTYSFVHGEFSSKEQVSRDEIVKSAHRVCNFLGKKSGLFIIMFGDYWLIEGGTSTVKLLSYSTSLVK